jgi:hypothetical protein
MRTNASKYLVWARRHREHRNSRWCRNPPIPQVVFYQSGIGSENNFYAEYIQGATGASLGNFILCLVHGGIVTEVSTSRKGPRGLRIHISVSFPTRAPMSWK